MPAENELLAVYGDPVTPELARTLDLGGYQWKPVANADEAAEFEPPAGWAGAIIDCGADATGAWAFARTIRKREPGNPPVEHIENAREDDEPPRPTEVAVECRDDGPEAEEQVAQRKRARHDHDHVTDRRAP